MHIIMRADGKRLCQDGFWRDFASFGTFPECVKVYRQQGRATSKAKSLNAHALYTKRTNPSVIAGIHVVTVPPSYSMDASGRIFNCETNSELHNYHRNGQNAFHLGQPRNPPPLSPQDAEMWCKGWDLANHEKTA